MKASTCSDVLRVPVSYDGDADPVETEPAKLNYSLMFDAVCRELFYDEEADQFIVKFVEFYNIEAFLNDSRG